MPDVYQYVEIPPFLRRQIAFVFKAAIGPWHPTNPYGPSAPRANDWWTEIAGVLERECQDFPGVAYGENDQDRCLRFLGSETDPDEWLSLVELGCRVLDVLAKNDHEINEDRYGCTEDAADAIAEINVRFIENEFGYQYENSKFIRIDERYVHAEIVKPALALLAAKGFEVANEEFMTAHRHYRNGENKDAVVAANRAFEATLKAICSKKNWAFASGDRASELITLVRNKGLFPDYLDKSFDSYVSMMKTGLPSVRNNAGGHGGAPDAPKVPGYFAAYAIHLTASNILLVMSGFLAK